MPPTLPDSSRSIWLDRYGSVDRFTDGTLPEATDVVVVGAGIAGLVTAIQLATAGVDVVVLDARRIAGGASGHSSAKVAVLHELHAHEIAARSGVEVARAYLDANRHGLDWLRQRVVDRDVDCDWEARAAITYATTRRGGREVRKEAATLADAGLEVSTQDPSLPFATTAAVRLDDQAQFDPVPFLHDLATEVADRGGHVLEGIRALGVERDGPGRVLVTDAGRIRCRHLVAATGLPFLDRGLFFARTEPQSSYVLACRVEQLPPAGMYLASDGPKRSLRTTPDPAGGQDLLLVGGESHKTGQGGRTTRRYETLAAWTDEHFGLREVTHRFMTEDLMSPDQVPFAGPLLPGDDAVLVATGFTKWGFTNAVAAAEVNVAHITGTAKPSWSSIFTTNRIPRSGLRSLASANANVATHLLGGWAGTLVPRPSPGRGRGRVRATPIDRVGVSVDEDGAACKVSGVCPHLGAILTWNDAERTWDCPLHGSRFDADGSLLHGPAVEDLQTK